MDLPNTVIGSGRIVCGKRLRNGRVSVRPSVCSGGQRHAVVRGTRIDADWLQID